MTIERGEIYFVNLNPVQGREQSGERPVLVISSDTLNRLPLVITVVVGTKGDRIKQEFPTNVRVMPSESGLPIETFFLCFQIRSLDASRFPSTPAGKLDRNSLVKVEMALRYCLNL